MRTAYRPPSVTEHSAMAHNGQHRETARRDELEEFHQFDLENWSFGMDSVRCVRRKRRSWTNSARVDCILQLKICVITASVMACGCRSQSSSNFSFDDVNFVQSDFTILQDASITIGHINLNSNGAFTDTESRGRVLYNRPVQFLEPATNSVASFQTSFSFIIFRQGSTKGHGFSFGFFPDLTAVGDPGKYMGTLSFAHTTTNNSISSSSKQLLPGFDNTFVVEFDTHQDIEFGDRSDNHVGVNWNSMASLNATDLTALGLNLVTTDNNTSITAWIEYSYPFRRLSIWMTNSVLNITNPPVLEVSDLDLSQCLLPSMYAGFAGGVGVGNNEVHTIKSWNFKSSFYSAPRPESRFKDLGKEWTVKSSFDSAPSPESSFEELGKDCGRDCNSKGSNVRIIAMGVCLLLAVFLVIVSALFFFRWRRQKAAEASMILKINPTFQGQPFQDLNPNFQGPPLEERKVLSTRSSLSSKLLNSARAFPSFQPFSPKRVSLGANSFKSPRASLNPFTPVREPKLTRLSSVDSLRSKHSRNGSGAGSKRFTTTLELDAVSSLGPRRYTYRELKLATNSFKETLGRGGFGTVYKGYLPNHNDGVVPVAVKEVAADSHQGEREFLAEVSIIAGLRHRHLVHIQGWCHEKGKLLLIHDFMENGSLDKHLYETSHGYPVLSWDVRYRALCHVASALTYLHDEAEKKIIHRDIKASNVLLDAKFNARLGDFGLARLSEHSQVADTTIVAGTMGYLAPEVVHTGKVTTKTDVYSFGTLILEVMCAKQPLDLHRPQREMLLGDLVWGLLETGRLLDAVDPRILGLYDEAKMTRALQVGLMCLHPDQNCRPPIRYALQMLLGDLALPMLPTHQPTISFGSGAVLIPMNDLLQSSMSTIAAAMESSQTTTTVEKSAEFEAPWMLKISSPDLTSNDGNFPNPLTSSVKLWSREQVTR